MPITCPNRSQNPSWADGVNYYDASHQSEMVPVRQSLKRLPKGVDEVLAQLASPLKMQTLSYCSQVANRISRGSRSRYSVHGDSACARSQSCLGFPTLQSGPLAPSMDRCDVHDPPKVSAASYIGLPLT